mmetsp:Transcript_11075/g.18106  ORF Transcript_11075/g.18106 Transcript_11075/m.18106 type:complete len:112 (-) Transcript_11075:173-508(-)
MSSSVAARLSANVTSVYATNRAFAALKSDGELVLWGDAYQGGNAGSPSVAALLLTSGGGGGGDVVNVCSNDVAFSAIKSNGSAVVWGHSTSIPYPGLLSGVTTNLAGGTCI